MPDERFMVGDLVEWESQAGGFAQFKRGKIVAIVPAGEDPIQHLPGWAKGEFGLMPRKQESYIVQIGDRSTVNWPRTKHLRRVPA